MEETIDYRKTLVRSKSDLPTEKGKYTAKHKDGHLSEELDFDPEKNTDVEIWLTVIDWYYRPTKLSGAKETFEKVIIRSEQDLPPKDKGDGEISVKTYVKCLNGDIVTARYDFKNKQWFDRHFAVIDDAVAILQSIPSSDKAEGMTKDDIIKLILKKSDSSTHHLRVISYDDIEAVASEILELSLSPRKMTDGVCPNCGAEIKIEIKEMTNSEILDKYFKISHKKK